MRYQLTCPKCKHEFAYDNGYYDKNITRLGNEIKDITLQLHNYRALPLEERQDKVDWYHRAKVSLGEKQKELAELKAIRKISDQQVNAMFIKIFKGLVKDEFGDEVYKRLISEAESELEAYKISGLMKHEYTRSNSKTNVISINKL